MKSSVEGVVKLLILVAIGFFGFILLLVIAAEWPFIRLVIRGVLEA